MALLLFGENWYILDRRTQTIAGQTVTTWARGALVNIKVSISNMAQVRLAEAQGVKANGTAMLPVDSQGKDIYPIGMNTYLENEKTGQYIRIADPGVTESGMSIFGERQVAVEGVTSLPVQEDIMEDKKEIKYYKKIDAKTRKILAVVTEKEMQEYNKEIHGGSLEYLFYPIQ